MWVSPEAVASPVAATSQVAVASAASRAVPAAGSAAVVVAATAVVAAAAVGAAAAVAARPSVPAEAEAAPTSTHCDRGQPVRRCPKRQRLRGHHDGADPTSPGANWTDTVPTSLLATTTFVGEGPSSTLVLTGAGTFSLANVSDFGFIDLPAGSNTVTVTGKTLSDGPVTINDGASGNNSVTAAGDTAASKGKSLTYVTGSGTDSFTGGFENDTVDVASTSVGGDTLTGGSGTNTLVLTGTARPTSVASPISRPSILQPAASRRR